MFHDVPPIYTKLSQFSILKKARRSFWPHAGRPLRIHPSLIGSRLAVEGGLTVRNFVRAAAAAAIALAPTIALAQVDRPPTKWVTSWTASVHGPFPVGNPSAQPDQR